MNAIIKRKFESDGMGGEAWFSPDEAYRYYLSRTWDPALPPLVFVMLNPSTATERLLDPTIRKCIKFAKRLGRGGVVILNLFALRSTDPGRLYAHPDPVGPLNDEVIERFTSGAAVVCAWGVHGELRSRDREVWRILYGTNGGGAVGTFALKVTKDGHPGHPLYIRDDAPLVPFAVRPMKLETVGAPLAIAEDRPGHFKPRPFGWRRRK